MRLDLEGSTLNVTTCSVIAVVASLLHIIRSSELESFAKEAITKLSDAPARRFALASFLKFQVPNSILVCRSDASRGTKYRLTRNG